MNSQRPQQLGRVRLPGSSGTRRPYAVPRVWLSGLFAVLFAGTATAQGEPPLEEPPPESPPPVEAGGEPPVGVLPPDGGAVPPERNIDGGAGVINRKGDKELPPGFDPKTLGKTKELKGAEDLEIKVDRNFGDKFPCKKVPLETQVSIDFQNFKLEDFTKIMACLTGKRFMIAQGVTGQITIMSPEPVTVYEAYRAFLSALEANNLTTIERGKFTRIVPKPKARSEGAPVGKGFSADDTMQTVLLPIRHILADEVKELLQNFMSDGSDLTVYTPTNTLIVTEIGSNIPRLKKIIRQVDQPTGAARIWVRPIINADAAEIGGIVTKLFGGDKAGKAGRPGAAPARPVPTRPNPGQPQAQNPGAAPSGATLGEAGGELTVETDARTNQLIIVTDRSTYLRIDKFIRKIDVPIPGEGQIHIHQLENAAAKDVQATLQSLTGGGNARAGNRPARPTPTTPAVPGAPAAGSANSPMQAAQIGEDVKITAHEPTNSLVIIGSLKDYLTLRNVIRQLDIRRKQIYLESVIMEITSDKNRELGLSGYGGASFDVEGQQVPLLFGNSLGPDISNLQSAFPGGFGAMLVGPLIDASLGSTGSGSEPSQISIPAFGFSLKALQSNSDVNILQTPHILTTDNEEAEIEVGRRVPFNSGVGGALGGLGALGLGGLGGLGLGGSTGASGGLGNLSSLLGAASGLGTIQYADIKISLKLKPTVNESSLVRLEIEQQIDDFDGIDQRTGAPNTSNRRVKNIVVVRDQQPVVIGGLMNDREVEGVRKVPVLGDIPLLGALFRQTTTKIERKNLLMIIIPHIIDDPSDLKRIHEQRMEEIRNFAEYLATRKKEYMGQINYGKKHGLLQEIHRVVEQTRDERYQLEQQLFDESDVDPVGPADSHDVDYDPYRVEEVKGTRAPKEKPAPKEKAPAPAPPTAPEAPAPAPAPESAPPAPQPQ
ncbi:MAG: type II secretion system secretin GspD [Myxococcales bacterium]|nr:type II secretion system secretin GspD [Myxococcales bacterium]